MNKGQAALGSLSFFFALLCAPAPAAAAEPTDSPANTQKLVDELREMAARARRERSADPWLLEAMDGLVQRYYWPWRTQALDESFKDGDYTKSPPWEVAAGTFWVDESLGLRSKAAPPATTQAPPAKKQRFEDILRDAIRKEMERGGGQQPAEPVKAVAITEIYLPQKITNAFALDIVFSQHQPSKDEARMEFSVLEAARGSRAYVVALASGAEPALELLLTQGSKVSVIERASLDKAPATGAVQRLSWRRDPQGNMVIALNDKPLIEVRDRGLNAPFKTLGLVNRGGDYAVRKIALFNTQ